MSTQCVSSDPNSAWMAIPHCVKKLLRHAMTRHHFIPTWHRVMTSPHAMTCHHVMTYLDVKTRHHVMTCHHCTTCPYAMVWHQPRRGIMSWLVMMSWQAPCHNASSCHAMTPCHGMSVCHDMSSCHHLCYDMACSHVYIPRAGNSFLHVGVCGVPLKLSGVPFCGSSCVCERRRPPLELLFPPTRPVSHRSPVSSWYADVASRSRSVQLTSKSNFDQRSNLTRASKSLLHLHSKCQLWHWHAKNIRHSYLFYLFLFVLWKSVVFPFF